jgi:hypothetical protein
LLRRIKPHHDLLLSAVLRVLLAGTIVALATAEELHAWALLAGASVALVEVGVQRWWSQRTGQEWTPVPPNESVLHRLRSANKERSQSSRR